MKKYLLIFLLTVLTVNRSEAQLGYTLDTSIASYTELSSPTDISNDAWNSMFSMSLPFSFTYFNRSFSNIYITFDGCFFSDSGDDYIFYGTDNFMPEDMDPMKSPISYEVSGSSPNRIFKIQYKNIWESSVDTSSFEYKLNCQIWLYENGSKIEYHFGPTSITDPGFTSFYIGIIDYDNSPYLAIDSNAANPVLVRVLNAGTFDGIPGYPVNGQVYTLTPEAGTSLKETVTPYAISVMPGKFLIRSELPFQAELLDMGGREVQSLCSNGNESTVSLTNNLPAGIYVLKIDFGNMIFAEKISVY